MQHSAVCERATTSTASGAGKSLIRNQQLLDQIQATDFLKNWLRSDLFR